MLFWAGLGILAPKRQKGGLPWEAAHKVDEAFSVSGHNLHLEDLPSLGCRALREHAAWLWLSGGSAAVSLRLMLFLLLRALPQ